MSSSSKWRATAVLPLVLLAYALVVVGSPWASASAGEVATASKVKKVDMVNFAFKPATLKIAKGDKVNFANTSTTTHTATRNGAFDTGLIKPGKSVTVRFKQNGSFAYHCEIHPSMRGKIIVD